MEKLTIRSFYEQHKKAILIGACLVSAYYLGYCKGFKTYHKTLVKACKAISDNIKVTTF